ncbi:ATP-binding protein [Frigoribacterium sp. CFBP9039]|uniref:ATP-binding protein n=1 Tax=unclassified Frigoribacterium TaxID=2627005 RepID=UPI0017841A25|nr:MULTISPECIES: ATP-binding protein [unclassified Frigoribacterium]MBD8702496.1 sensor histidine kinase [Frigoribacterium sp. CFBP 13712]MDY0944481.1 ATP-binding protein [Frigoribacterium sp. CFBP9039]
MVADQASVGPTAPPRPSRNPISRALLEKVVGRVVGAGGIVFGVQTIPSMVDQIGSMQEAWAWFIGISIFGGFVAVAVASIVVRGAETAAAFVAISYLIALITWPLAVNDPSAVQTSVPWLWYLCTVATAAAAYAFTAWIAVGYLFVAPLVYGLIRLTPSGGAVSLAHAALDSIYAVLLGGAVLILVVILRQAAANVDAAQALAVARYSNAIREHATELERVQVDAIVHDSVLTTFIQAARAYSPDERVLATNMARNAVAHLASAAAATPFDESTTTLESLRERLAVVSSEMGVSVDLKAGDLEECSIPSAAAEALYSAAVQALVNSSQHAGHGVEVRRWVGIDAGPDGGALIEVGDTGHGFDPAVVPGERLGVRVSIVERLRNAGGRACIDSRPGDGTVVRLLWPSGDITPPMPGRLS